MPQLGSMASDKKRTDGVENGRYPPTQNGDINAPFSPDGPFPRKGVPYYDEDGSAIGIGDVTPDTQRGDYFLDRESEEPRQQLSDWTRDYNKSHGHKCLLVMTNGIKQP